MLDLLDRPEYDSWFFSPGDLTEAGVDAVTPRGAALAAIEKSALCDRLRRMSAYMAHWHAFHGDGAAAALQSALERELREGFTACALPVLMLERSAPPAPSGARHARPARIGRIVNTGLRHALRRQCLSGVKRPTGRDLARLDFTEAGLALLEELNPEIPPSDQPRDEELRVVSHALAGEFDLGQTPLGAARVAAILQQHTVMSAATASELAPVLAEGLASFREEACGRCPVRCVDLPDAPKARAFFAAGHPSEMDHGEAL